MGVTFNPLQIISEWMSNGNLTAYVKSNPHADRISLVSSSFGPPLIMFLAFQQLVGVAEGLNYLHQYDVVHGDLKGVGAQPSPSSGLAYRCL